MRLIDVANLRGFQEQLLACANLASINLAIDDLGAELTRMFTAANVVRHCGSMEYKMSNGGAIIGTVNLRDIAETVRFIPQAENPSDENLVGFRTYINPLDIDPFARD